MRWHTYFAFNGIGKPKPLKHRGPGFWSRRITHEHRLFMLLIKIWFIY
ncbi:MAG: type II toxin-antitoxin system YoeB family toxin [Mycoplasmataceae bacterium]|nr:type II toxin-antitoxin system YoeB family toxin [Mycoplasmataceae bacterium]